MSTGTKEASVKIAKDLEEQHEALGQCDPLKPLRLAQRIECAKLIFQETRSKGSYSKMKEPDRSKFLAIMSSSLNTEFGLTGEAAFTPKEVAVVWKWKEENMGCDPVVYWLKRQWSADGQAETDKTPKRPETPPLARIGNIMDGAGNEQANMGTLPPAKTSNITS